MPARRFALAALAVILLILGGGVGAGIARGGWQATPKLALDLEGGTQVILTASSLDGRPIDAATMEQARQIMSDRVNAIGVAETEISIQGGKNIVVDVPGRLDEKTSEALRRTAASTASIASPRTASFRRPPVSISDRPSFITSPSPISRAISAQVSPRTSALRRGASCPSVAPRSW